MKTWSASAAAVGLALLAGCGGGGGGAPLTAPQLVAQGDQICKQNQDRFGSIQKEPPNNAAEAADLTQQLIDSANEELEGLRDLTPPAQLAGAYSNYLDAKEVALNRLEEGHDAANDQDADRYAKLQQENDDSVPERLKLAQAVGFKACGRQPTL